MKLNYIAYYHDHDGYGRFNSRLVAALQKAGTQVKIMTTVHPTMPEWMQKQEGVDWGNLTISCLPPYLIEPVPGRHWLLSMTEGSLVSDEWVETINSSGVERVLVPCQHNAEAFRNSGVLAPVHVLPGGTDPDEFPVIQDRDPERPYTFMTLADRGFRKGYEEVWDAFYIAFGGKTTGEQNVRLMIKSLPKKEPTMVKFLEGVKERDQRIILRTEKVPNPYDVYAASDCLALPSHSEGWGMPHREAAMMGLPVITQKYSGMDDGFTEQWALVVEGSKIESVPKGSKMYQGEWMVADKYALAEKMRWCYDNAEEAKKFALSASQWLRYYQTWSHSALYLIQMVKATQYVC